MHITITHTATEGTLITGFGRDDTDIHEAIKPTFTWRKSPGWFIRGSRDRKPRTWAINAVAEKLRDMGHDVTVDLDTTLRPTAEVEADKTARLADRADALAAKAERQNAGAGAKIDRAREMASHIPVGQPLLVDHYSYKRDRNYRDKISATFERGFKELGEAQETQRRADVAGVANEHRHTAPATMRRIEKLEAEERKAVKMVTRCETSGKSVPAGWMSSDGTTSCPVCNRWKMTPAEGDRYPEHTPGPVDHYTQVLEETREQLAYWRQHLAGLEADGVKVWGPADFKKGDYVQDRFGWYKVVRVNKKTLSVEGRMGHTIPYDKVRGRRPADTEAAAS